MMASQLCTQLLLMHILALSTLLLRYINNSNNNDDDNINNNNNNNNNNKPIFTVRHYYPLGDAHMSITSYLKKRIHWHIVTNTLVAFADRPFHKVGVALANDWLPCLGSVYNL